MKLKLLVGALVLLIVMNLAAIAAFLVVQARHPRAPVEWRAGARERPLAGISREKRRELVAAMRGFHDETRGLIDETHALEEDLISAMGENPVPRARIDSLLLGISDNRLEIARRATDHMIAMGESLTPEEREHLMEGLMRMRGARFAMPAPPRGEE